MRARFSAPKAAVVNRQHCMSLSDLDSAAYIKVQVTGLNKVFQEMHSPHPSCSELASLIEGYAACTSGCPKPALHDIQHVAQPHSVATDCFQTRGHASDRSIQRC